jgi:hypothetical protein
MFIVKIAEEYEPFSFVWAPFVRSFPAQVRKARRIGVEEARVRLLERYFANQLVGTVTTIQRLFRWSKQEIYHALGQLMHRGSIRTDIIVEGKDHRYYGYVEQR